MKYKPVNADSPVNLSQSKLLATVIKGRKGFHTEVAEWATRQGFAEMMVDGTLVATAAFKKLARFKEHTIDVVVEALPKGTPSLRHLEDVIERALHAGEEFFREIGIAGDGEFLLGEDELRLELLRQGTFCSMI